MYELTVDEIKQEPLLVEEKMPDLYKSFIETEMILSEKRQKDISLMSKDQMFDFLMNRNVADHLNIYPDFVSNIITNYSNTIFKELNRLQIMDDHNIEYYQDILKKY